ncbi:ATP-grasp domain-containing protein [Actinokineospora globicatena]|uniref:ATP-grasp domain-containing protein n=1 Tax=Actinokineospora globicatena TaxID=103729 RepID=A0A9W6V825_9PSEU|nr:ATP-grasp domain-containing protein [Actinokineospora globicatena]GLW93440.1 ATP-grasp domain-containing protein [Actinokineospora globicatena]
MSEPSGPAVIVDPYSSGALFASALAERGIDVVAVLSAERPPEAYASSYQPRDYRDPIVYRGDLSEVVDRLRALDPRCVLAGCESGVELAERLAPLVTPARANVAGLADARRDKWAMASAVAAAGIPTIPQICTDDVDEVRAWLVDTGLVGADLVVKPPKSASTDGVVKVAGGVGWADVFTANLGRVNQFGEVDDRLLVQQYVTGTEYVIDTFSQDGVHALVDVCRYQKVDNGPYMAVYDTMRWLPETDPEIPGLLDYARRVLDAVGVRYGAAHVEIMLTESGPLLIELGARPHGGGQPRFNRIATGDSQIDRTVRSLVGEPVSETYRLARHQTCVFHIAPASGTVHGVSALDKVRDLPSHHFSVQNLTEGGPVQATRNLVDSLEFGFAILSHPDAEQVAADYQVIRGLERELVITSDQPAPIG